MALSLYASRSARMAGMSSCPCSRRHLSTKRSASSATPVQSCCALLTACAWTRGGTPTRSPGSCRPAMPRASPFPAPLQARLPGAAAWLQSGCGAHAGQALRQQLQRLHKPPAARCSGSAKHWHAGCSAPCKSSTVLTRKISSQQDFEAGSAGAGWSTTWRCAAG